jgi:hypothetical protein
MFAVRTRTLVFSRFFSTSPCVKHENPLVRVFCTDFPGNIDLELTGPTETPTAASDA